MFFAKIFRRFFFSIDAVLFNFIGTLYDLLIAISRTSILTQGDIATFAARIEVLLGIFMLFKVSFSLITYVVNPDDFSDKSKGFGKLIQSSVISLVLLVLVPYIFQMAFSLQTKVLEGNILARLILGEDSEQSGVEDNFMTEAGEKMAYYVMLPFFKPNYSINLGEGSDLSECINIYQKDDGDKNVFSEECKNALTSVNNKQSNGMDDTDIENYANGITEQSLGLTFRMNAAISTVGSDSDEQFVIDYKSPISTVVAVIVCLLLVSFCIDIGIRSIKLAFLQLIYPIPVISFMDPKSGKDGMFSKWYKMCLSTFLSLFVRLLALYFGLYIISKVGSFGVYDVVNGSQITNGWIMIFIIIGVLMFIKQLPKILENMGIKLEGEGKFSLNPLKKVFDENNGIAGAKAIKRTGIAAGAAGLAGAAAFGSNLLTAGSRIRNAEGVRGKLRAGLNTFTGGFSAMRRGATSGLKGEKLGKSFSNSYSGAMEAMKREQERADDNVGKMGVRMAKAQKAMGMQTAGDRVKKEQERLKKINEGYDTIKSTALATDAQAKALNKKIETIKRTAPDVNNYDLNKASDALKYQKAVEKYNDELDKVESELDGRIQALASGGSVYDKDGNINEGATKTIHSIVSNIDSSISGVNKLGKRIDDEFAEIDKKAKTNVKATSGQATGATSQISASGSAQHALDVDRYAENKKSS